MTPRRACVAATLVLVLLGHVVAALTDAQTVVRSDAACRMHFVRHVVRSPGCIAKPIMSRDCQGVCRSYSVDMPETDNIHHSCNCCQATGSVKRHVRIRCADDVGGNPTFLWRVKEVEVTTGCMCRPCSTIPGRVCPTL